MAKFYGQIGYLITSESLISPGVWESTIIEKNVYGDILRNSKNFDSSDKVNNDLALSNKISIVVDPYALDNFQFIKYCKFMGTKWSVTSVEVLYPRLILTLGGVYNV